MKHIVLLLALCVPSLCAKAQKVTSEQVFFELVQPTVCDSDRLSLVVFYTSPSYYRDDRLVYKMRKKQVAHIEHVAYGIPYVGTIMLDTRLPHIAKLAQQLGCEQAPAAILYRNGAPAAQTCLARSSRPITYGLGAFNENASCFPGELISDIQLKDFVLKNFGEDIQRMQIERAEHAARVELLGEPRPDIFSTGGAWPDWIAAFNPWPLYWG